MTETPKLHLGSEFGWILFYNTDSVSRVDARGAVDKKEKVFFKKVLLFCCESEAAAEKASQKRRENVIKSRASTSTLKKR